MSRYRLDARQSERFQRLAWPYLPVLLRTARYLTHRDHEAEDLVQETLIKAMNAIDSFRDGTNMKAWLMVILRRTHIDWIRAKQRHPDVVSLDASQLSIEQEDHGEAGLSDERWDEPEELLNRFEDEAIVDALKRLPEAIRWTLLLVDVEQIDHTDAANVLEVPIGTIKSRVHRGRQMLRDHLFEIAEYRGWIHVKASEG